jgi:hypothetical protein
MMISIVCVAILAHPSISLRKRLSQRLGVATLALSLLVLCWIAVGVTERLPTPEAMTIACTMIMLSFASDFVFIVATRKVLRQIQDVQSFWTIVLIIVVNFACAICFSLLPYEWGFDKMVQGLGFVRMLGVAAYFDSMLNSIDAVVASLIAILTALLLIHRLLWPILTRTLFRMQDIGTKGRRGVLVTFGLAILSWSGVTFTDLMRELLKALRKG